MTRNSSEMSQLLWCFECHCETWQESRDLPPSEEGLPRRARVCVECGRTTATTVELSEVEYTRLRRAEREFEGARRALRQVVDAVLEGNDLPAPFRRTEAMPR